MNEMQSFPEESMIRLLSGRKCVGTFESHITVNASGDPDQRRFRDLCREIGVKAVLIELPTGQTPRQLMTSAYHRGDLQQATEDVAAMARKLRGGGFTVTRVKLEVIAANEGIIQDL